MELQRKIEPAPPTARWPRALLGTLGQRQSSLKKLWAYRGLVGIWLKYTLQARYRQKILGLLWIILLPITQALIFDLIFSELLRYSLEGVPFVSFYLSGLIGWSIFSSGLHKAVVTFKTQREVVSQLPFPREILVIVPLAETLVDAGIMFVILILLNAFHGITPALTLLALPALLAIQLMLTLGLMLSVAIMGALVRDVQPLLSVVVMLLFYLTPVIYPSQALSPKLQQWLALNPLTALIDAYRSILLHGQLPALSGLIYPTICSILALLGGYTFFKAYEHHAVDVL